MSFTCKISPLSYLTNDDATRLSRNASVLIFNFQSPGIVSRLYKRRSSQNSRMREANPISHQHEKRTIVKRMSSQTKIVGWKLMFRLLLLTLRIKCDDDGRPLLSCIPYTYSLLMFFYSVLSDLAFVGGARRSRRSSVRRVLVSSRIDRIKQASNCLFRLSVCLPVLLIPQNKLQSTEHVSARVQITGILRECQFARSPSVTPSSRMTPSFPTL